MGYGRTPFKPDGAPPFTIELPPGLIFADFSELDPQPDLLKFATVCASIAAVNGPASIVLSQLSARDQTSLQDIAALCAAERGTGSALWTVEGIGGETHRHPGLQAEVRFGCEFVLFEDGGQVLILEATGASSIWREYEPFLKRAMLSIELSAPLGPTLPLEAGNEAPQLLPGMPDPDTVAAAEREADLSAKAVEGKRLIEARQYADAEKLFTDRYADSRAFALLGRLYEEQLRASDDLGQDVREKLYRRSLLWKIRCYPEPHTEIEAVDYARGMAEDHQRLVRLLGYDPDG
jgi:hypothetical protein